MGANEESGISPGEWLDLMLQLLGADAKHQELLLAHPDFPPSLLAPVAEVINELPEAVRLASAIAANRNVSVEALERMWEANYEAVFNPTGEPGNDPIYEKSAMILAAVTGVVGDPLDVRHYLRSNFANLESFVAINGVPCSQCRSVMKFSGDERDFAAALDEHQQGCNQ